MKKFVYKVCYDWGRGPQSFCVAPGQGGVFYTIDEKTKPEITGTPLFAYDTEENAMAHFYPGCFRLFKAEAKISSIPLPELFCDYRIEDDFIHSYWEKWRIAKVVVTDEHPTLMKPFPKGTVLCDWIMLRKEIVVPCEPYRSVWK
jgi:hypothetical protein